MLFRFIHLSFHLTLFVSKQNSRSLVLSFFVCYFVLTWDLLFEIVSFHDISFSIFISVRMRLGTFKFQHNFPRALPWTRGRSLAMACGRVPARMMDTHTLRPPIKQSLSSSVVQFPNIKTLTGSKLGLRLNSWRMCYLKLLSIIMSWTANGILFNCQLRLPEELLSSDNELIQIFRPIICVQLFVCCFTFAVI